MKRRDLLMKSATALGGLLAARAFPAEPPPCPPVLGSDLGACGGESFAEVARKLQLGQSIDFVGGRNPLTKYNPEISWQAVSVYFDPNRHEIQYMGKPQSGVTEDWQHYIFDEQTSTWRTTGQALFPNLGHAWTTGFDPKSGDYFNHVWTEDSIRWMQRSSGTWTKTSPRSGLLAGVNALNSITWHPNLFGADDGGLVVQNISETLAWRYANNSWTSLGQRKSQKVGQGVYLPWADEVLFGGGKNGGDWWRIGAGSGGKPGSVSTSLGNPLPGAVTVGSTQGKLMLAPSTNEILIVEFGDGNTEVYKSSDDGASWSSTGLRHPFAALAGYSVNGFTANSSTEHGVIVGLTSRTGLDTETFRIWKPNF